MFNHNYATVQPDSRTGQSHALQDTVRRVLEQISYRFWAESLVIHITCHGTTRVLDRVTCWQNEWVDYLKNAFKCLESGYIGNQNISNHLSTIGIHDFYKSSF